jgi:hypothetical protein
VINPIRLPRNAQDGVGSGYSHDQANQRAKPSFRDTPSWSTKLYWVRSCCRFPFIDYGACSVKVRIIYDKANKSTDWQLSHPALQLSAVNTRRNSSLPQ